MGTPVCGGFGTQDRATRDRAKGLCLIVITVVLGALFKSQTVEVGGVWGLIEDGLK